MTPSSRIFIALTSVGIALMPSVAFAKIGLQEGYELSSSSAASSESSASSVSSISTGELLEIQATQAKWAERISRYPNFWANMMNFRSEASAFNKEHDQRREQRRLKRLECRTAVRSANRDSIVPITESCYRATLTLDLEILRKEKQYIETLPNIAEDVRGSAKFHNQNLADAISTIIQAIDAGVFEGKEGLMEAKKNLGVSYREHYRLAMTRLRIERATNWLNHLLLRLRDVEVTAAPPAPVLTKIQTTIECLELREEQLRALLPMEDNDALIAAFRQAQSDVKFCTDTALEAHALNKEIEQAEAENPES